MDGFSDPITWSRNFDDEEVDEEEPMELPKVEFVVRLFPFLIYGRCLLLSCSLIS